MTTCRCPLCFSSQAKKQQDSRALSTPPFPGLLESEDKRWSKPGKPVTLTYSFSPTLPTYYENSKEQVGFQPVDSQWQEIFRNAFQRWAEVADVSFVEVQSGGQTVADIEIGKTSTQYKAYAFIPSRHPKGGDIWINNQMIFEPNISLEPINIQYAYYIALHEIGHALGLIHPVSFTAQENTHQFSIMAPVTHYDSSYDSSNGDRQYPLTPQLYDVATAQYLYGENKSTRAGNTLYQWERVPIATIWDAGGRDTIDASNLQSSAVINLAAGSFSSIGGGQDNVAIAFGATIESAVGGPGDDTLLGNPVGNRLVGNEGADNLMGYAGNDTLVGGAGADVLTGGAGADRFVFSSPVEGGDTIVGFSLRDRIVVSAEAFGINGKLSPRNFVSGLKPTVRVPQFLVKANSLYFDPDGIGMQPKTLLAEFTAVKNLSKTLPNQIAAIG